MKLADAIELALTQRQRSLDGLNLTVVREGELFKFTLKNTTATTARIGEFLLAEFQHGLAPETAFYGEGFSMFCSTAGTLAAPEDVDPLTEVNHYRLVEPVGFHSCYNYMRLGIPGSMSALVGFTSCRRFDGRFNFNDQTLQIVMNLEKIPLAPGEEVVLEELMVAEGADAPLMMERFAARIVGHHPRLNWDGVPNGWCSWYCYGPDISSKKILTNLEAFRTHLPDVRYIQIDDGYQPWMGDWLESTAMFEGGVKQVIASIREAGFEPAIWVAPFVASPESRLFREHPDWFVKDADGAPLNSGKVTFGGWRQGPWYILDGTHPEALAYLEEVFRTLHAWGCTYFKLDANVWGALPFGEHYDSKATAIEAYRRGMAAIRRGAGNSFILGCNQPYWPSLGEIHGSRTSYDVFGNYKTIARVARENLLRNWMNDRLWWNDPDCIKLDALKPKAASIELIGGDGKVQKDQGLTQDQVSFHMAATLASGGMMLCGDAVISYTPEQWRLLRILTTAPGIAATFDDDRLEMGWITDGHARHVILLNWTHALSRRTIRFDGAVRISDFWTKTTLGEFTSEFNLELPPTSGRVLTLESIG